MESSSQISSTLISNSTDGAPHPGSRSAPVVRRAPVLQHRPSGVRRAPLSSNGIQMLAALQCSIATSALMAYATLDIAGTECVSFERLWDAMKNSNPSLTQWDKDVFKPLIQKDGTITQKSFIQGVSMLYQMEQTKERQRSLFKIAEDFCHSDSIEISESRESSIMTSDFYSSEDEEDEICPQALALATVLFHLLDNENEEELSTSQLHKGLMKVDSELFTEDIMDELVSQLEENGASTISKDQFIKCFSQLVGSTDLERMRQNIEDMGKDIEEREKRKKKMNSQYEIDEGQEKQEENHFDFNARAEIEKAKQQKRFLKQQLRHAKLEKERKERELEKVTMKTDHSVRLTQMLEEQNSKMKEKLKTTEKEKEEMKKAEKEYQEMASLMASELNKMRIELQKVKEQQREDPKLQRQRRWHSPGLILRMQNELRMKDDLLQKTNKAKAQTKIALKRVKKSEKKKEKKMAILTKTSLKFELVAEERIRLQKKNQELLKIAAVSEKQLNEKNFEEEGFLGTLSIPEGGPSFIMNSPAHIDSIGQIGFNLAAVAEEVESTSEYELMSDKVAKLEKLQKEKEEELKRKNEEILSKNRELKTKQKELDAKQKRLRDIEGRLKFQLQEHLSSQDSGSIKLEKTNDENIYNCTIGEEKKTVRWSAAKGQALIRVGGGYITFYEYSQIYKKPAARNEHMARVHKQKSHHHDQLKHKRMSNFKSSQNSIQRASLIKAHKISKVKRPSEIKRNSRQSFSNGAKFRSYSKPMPKRTINRGASRRSSSYTPVGRKTSRRRTIDHSSMSRTTISGSNSRRKTIDHSNSRSLPTNSRRKTIDHNMSRSSISGSNSRRKTIDHSISRSGISGSNSRRKTIDHSSIRRSNNSGSNSRRKTIDHSTISGVSKSNDSSSHGRRKTINHSGSTRVSNINKTGKIKNNTRRRKTANDLGLSQAYLNQFKYL